MDMNKLLAELYNTNGVKTASAPAPDAAQQEKLALAAQGQLFLKMASSGALGTIDGKGVDVTAMLKNGSAEGQQIVDQLWGNFQDHLQKTAAAATEFEQRKQAEFPPKKEEGKPEEKGKGEPDEKKKLEEKAKEEHEKKAEELRKVASADFQGRVMAHAMVQELGLISNGSADINKTAASAVEQIYKTAGALAAPPAAPKTASSEMAAHSTIRGLAHGAGEFLKKHGPAAAVGAAAGAAGHAAATHGKSDKEASAIDRLAVEAAIQKVASWAYEGAKAQNATEEQAVEYAKKEAADAADKIAAADTLHKYDADSVKVAAAPDWQTAIDWRACELLEGAGYKINWPAG